MYFKQAATEELSRTEVEDLTDAQYRAAERGFFGLLRRKRISRQFIERHGEDLFGQALFEYTRTIRAGKEIRKPVAWIVLCAWSRTIRELESSNWRPRLVSTDSVAELSADATPAPDEALLTEDRYRKVRDAIEDLPDYQRELLSRSYFEGKSIREAARELGWTPSKAQRAHEAAQRGLRKRLGPKDLLGIPAGLATVLHRVRRLLERAWDLLRRPFDKGGSGGGAPSPDTAEAVGHFGRRAVTDVHHGPLTLAARACRRVSDLGRRLLSSGGVESTAAAADGGARIAEACKAIAAVCLIGTGAIAGGGALLEGGHDQRHAQPPHRVVSWRKPPEESSTAPSTPNPRPVAVPTTTGSAAPKARRAPIGAGAEPQAHVSSDVNAAGDVSPQERRAQHRRTEEATTNTGFEASQVAATEEEEWRDGITRAGAATSAEPSPTSSTSGGGNEAATPAPAPTTPKVRAEETQTKTQFQGGLP